MHLPSELTQCIDDLMKADLLFGRTTWFGLLSRSTEVVAIGLLLELPELLFEIVAIIWRLRDKWKFHITFPERNAPDWVKVVAFVGWFLIVGGVVGEWVTNIDLNDVDASIQQDSDTRLAETTKEAGEAKTSAVKAAAAASFAIDAAHSAGIEADDAKEKALDAKRQAARAGKEIIEVKKESATLRAQNLATEQELKASAETRKRLEESLNPRLMYLDNFSDGTTNIDDLKSLSGWKVQFRYIPSDPETARAALDLAELFKAGGWTVESIKPLANVTPEALGQEGVTVEPYRAPKREHTAPTSQALTEFLADTASQTQSSGVADVAIKWLRENNWDAQYGFAEPGEVDEKTILLVVGMKPLPYFRDPQYKKAINDDNRRRHIDPNRYKTKTVLHKCLVLGELTVFCGPTHEIGDPEKR